MKALHQFVRRAGIRGRQARRGTVLILALGVLAILSIAALSYVTIVRLERSNVAVAVRGGDYEAKVNQTVDHVRALLAADLFGNKIVDQDVPFAVTVGGQRVWPGRFEDGDYRDAITFDLNTFNTAPGPQDAPSAGSLLNIASGERAPADDAYLASTEPKWDISGVPGSLYNTQRWPQITSLRSAYVYDENGSPQSTADDRWVRGDGRFVDLGSWFYATTVDGYADPSVSLLDWSDSRVRQIGPPAGINQDVYQRQMNDMSGAIVSDLGTIRPSDERQWVDTDGDLRPDARWTVLDQLNIIGGLKWVVAARITDASALVNVNASIEFGGSGGGYPSAELLGDGRTPADVDLPRLLESMARASGTPYYANEVSIGRLFAGGVAYERHLLDGLGMGFVVDDSPLNGSTGFTAFNAWNPGTPSTPMQRTEFWRLFGQNALQPAVEGRRGGGYPVRELVDLAGFWGTNNSSVVSRVEIAFDGTEANGYLPNNTDNIFGPLRSKESPASIRAWMPTGGSLNIDDVPTAVHVHDSARRLLTTVSGVGLQSPVPAINPANPSLLAVDKVRIDAPLTPTGVQAAFQSLVWALAPTATNQPLARGAAAGIDDEDAHYGGYFANDPGPGFRSLARHLYPPTALPTASDPLASFAVITAASIAVNTADAIDTTGGGVTVDPPTVAALYNAYEPPTNAAFGAIPLGTRFAHGDILPAALPWIDSAGTNPYLIVGLERQPFLREVTFITVYSDSTFDGVGNDDSFTGAQYPSEVLGSAVRFVLHNPWPEPLSLGPQYKLVVPEMPDDGDPMTADLIDDPSTTGAGEIPFRIDLPAVNIAPGESMGFVWLYDVSNDNWDAIRAEILAKPDFSSCFEIATSSVSPTPVGNNRSPFNHLVATPGKRGVLVTYTDPNGALPELVLDRMMPSGTTNFPEFRNTNFDFRQAGSGMPVDRADNFPIGFSPSNMYFLTLGWDPVVLSADARWNNGAPTTLSGRLIQTSSLSRPSARRGNGMSAVVIEDAGRNEVKERQEALAWFIGALVNDDATIQADPRSVVVDLTNNTGISFPVNSTRAFAPGDITFADDDLPYGTGDVELPVFSLYVPNKGLITSSDTLRITAFAHTCKDCGTVADAANLNNWRTVSEKLGATLEADYGAASLTNVVNAHFGVLDPTRYVPGGDLLSGNLPNTMKIPLALRVPDCFEANRITDGSNLVQGRINLNTAPREVISALPLVAPVNAIADPTGAPNAPLAQHNPSGDNRVDLIAEYRDPTLGVNGLTAVSAANLPFGLRPINIQELDSGFATAAELAILGRWNSNGTELDGAAMATQPGTFLELGADVLANDFSPLQTQESVADIFSYGSDPMTMVPDQEAVRPVDDPEERLALYRAVSNIATARSDIFLAWIVIRGYDPQTIEQIRVRQDSNTPTDQEVINAMDNTDIPFLPVHESRWLVVFDRTQTESGLPLRQPTDRPRVLMKVQLPSAKP